MRVVFCGDDPMTKPEPFGQIAIRKGFTTSAQVDAALDVQTSLRQTGKPRLIGMIMLDMGMISSEQLIDVLKHYETRSATQSGAPHRAC
jgi:hypothetical protein